VWLITCQDGDQEAAWIGERLRALGLVPLELVTASELVYEARWEHRVGAHGVSTTLRLADGRQLDCSDVDGLLNRLVWLSADGYLGASDEDRDYATAELQALVLSWLAGFGPRALNPPVPPSLSAPWCSSCEWRARTLAAGARIRPYTSDEESEAAGDAKLIVIDGVAVGGASPGPGGAAVGGEAPWLGRTDPAALALATGLDVFEASFTTAGDGAWELLDVNPMASFSGAPGGAATALAALAAVLRARSEPGAP
jgi:hypothetical protein